MESQIQEARQQHSSTSERLRVAEDQLFDKISALGIAQSSIRELEKHLANTKQIANDEAARRSDAEHALALAEEQVNIYLLYLFIYLSIFSILLQMPTEAFDAYIKFILRNHIQVFLATTHNFNEIFRIAIKSIAATVSCFCVIYRSYIHLKLVRRLYDFDILPISWLSCGKEIWEPPLQWEWVSVLTCAVRVLINKDTLSCDWAALHFAAQAQCDGYKSCTRNHLW